MNSANEVRKIADDIRDMRIRGAGEIARSSVQALLITAKSSKANTAADFLEDLNSTAKMLLATRPTAVSLPNGIRYVMRRVTTQAQQTDNVDELRARAIKTGEDFIANSLTAIARIGEIGAKRIRDGDKILTHCQSRAVSSVFKTAWNQGKRFEVVATETRPRFQGRITARDLGSTGIPVTLILDDAARYFMDKVDKVLVGADAVTANGALVNKIGTSLVALAAHEARVRVFVAAETYKFSPETMIGELIEIEERNPSEVISPGELNQLPHTVVRNPSFDVTPPQYIDLIITERGIIPPQAAVLILQEQFGFLTPEELTEYHTVRMAEQH